MREEEKGEGENEKLLTYEDHFEDIFCRGLKFLGDICFVVFVIIPLLGGLFALSVLALLPFLFLFIGEDCDKIRECVIGKGIDIFIAFFFGLCLLFYLYIRIKKRRARDIVKLIEI